MKNAYNFSVETMCLLPRKTQKYFENYKYIVPVQLNIQQTFCYHIFFVIFFTFLFALINYYKLLTCFITKNMFFILKFTYVILNA